MQPEQLLNWAAHLSHLHGLAGAEHFPAQPSYIFQRHPGHLLGTLGSCMFRGAGAFIG